MDTQHPDEDLGPADFFAAVSTEHRPLPAWPALILYLAVPLLAVPSFMAAVVAVPALLALRAAKLLGVSAFVRAAWRRRGRRPC